MVFVLLLLLAAAPAFDECFRAGLLALQRNDLGAALANLETASQLAPKNARVWIALSQTYWKLKENAKADVAAARAEAHGSTDSVVQSSLAIYYAESGRVLKSAEAQARYATLVPAEPAARERAESMYFQVAQPLLQQGKFAEAIDVLTAATRNVKNSAQLELALGVACYALRRFDQAASAFLNVIAIAPETEQPYVFLGRFLDQIQSRLPEVTTRFISYETANPANSLGYYLHAKALNIQSIEPENARKLLEKALELNERDSAAHFELGVLFDRTLRYPEAAREFERAAELAPADPAPHYRLSRIYDRLGRRESAQSERERHAVLLTAQQDDPK